MIVIVGHLNVSLGSAIMPLSDTGFFKCLIQVLNSSVVRNILCMTSLKYTLNTFKTSMKHLKTLFRCIRVIECRRLKLNITKSSIFEQLDVFT